MTLRRRVERLEGAIRPEDEDRHLIAVMVRTIGSTEDELQRLEGYGLVWHRREDETEDEFIARAKSESPAKTNRRSLRVFLGYRERSDEP